MVASKIELVNDAAPLIADTLLYPLAEGGDALLNTEGVEEVKQRRQQHRTRRQRQRGVVATLAATLEAAVPWRLMWPHSCGHTYLVTLMWSHPPRVHQCCLTTTAGGQRAARRI